MISKKALLLVDLQNDFCPGGNLAVNEGDKVIPIANELQNFFDLIIATKDWHPKDHMSLAINHPNHQVGDVICVDGLNQVLWPVHCLQNSKGAEFHVDLNTEKIKKVFHKGIDKKIDSYSAFFDNAHKRSTGLSDYLYEQNINEIYIMGLATDYCVKYTALDAIHLGLITNVIIDGCRGVELQAGDTEKAITEMVKAGVVIVNSSCLIKPKV